MSSRKELNNGKREYGDNRSNADRGRNRTTSTASSIAAGDSGDHNSSTEGRGTTAEKYAALKQKLKELELEMKREEDQKREEEQLKMDKKLEKATKEVAVLRDENKGLQNQVATAQKNERFMKEKLLQRNEKIVLLEKEVQELKVEKCILAEEKKHGEKKSSDLEQNLSMCKAELVETKIKASEDANTFAQTSAKLETDIEEMRQNNAFLVTRRPAILHDQLVEARAQIKKLESMLDDLQHRSPQYEAEPFDEDEAPERKRRREQSMGGEGEVKIEPIDNQVDAPAADSAPAPTVSSPHHAPPRWRRFGADSQQVRQPRAAADPPSSSTEAAAGAAKMPPVLDAPF